MHLRMRLALGCQGTLLAPFEPPVSWHPQTLFRGAALQPLLSKFILVPSNILSQVQNLVFQVAKFNPINHNPVSLSIHIPLQGHLSFKTVNNTFQFNIISKLANSAFNSCTQMIDKYIEQNCPQD